MKVVNISDVKLITEQWTKIRGLYNTKYNKKYLDFYIKSNNVFLKN